MIRHKWAHEGVRHDQVGGSTRSEAFDTKAAANWRVNPAVSMLDICKAFYRFPNSTPAKPLHSMLNSGGFFFFGGCSQ